MIRSELIVRIARRFPHLVAKDSQVAVDLMLDALGKSLAEGRRAEIRGFGNFTVHQRPERVGRNPRSGETILVPEKRVPHFKSGLR